MIAPSVTEQAPHQPPRPFAELAPAAGRIGEAPEDFVVDELELYRPTGSGAHWYVRVRKRGVTTPEMLRAIARAAGVPERDLGHAGMKDKHAVTTQWVSVPESARAPAGWQLPDAISVVEVSRHGNKLRTGHQRGNRFRIRLTDVPAGGHARAHAIAERMLREGLPNYFGTQRFGRGGANLDAALRWLRGAARGRTGRFEAKLFPSVVQSEVFNRYLTLRRERGLTELLDGELVRLAGSKALFAVDDPARERARLLARDIVPTGPLPGPRLPAARGAAATLEQAAIADLGLEPSDLERLGQHAPGARRDVLVWPEALTIETQEPATLIVAFELPSGSYATELVRALTG